MGLGGCPVNIPKAAPLNSQRAEHVFAGGREEVVGSQIRLGFQGCPSILTLLQGTSSSVVRGPGNGTVEERQEKLE